MGLRFWGELLGWTMLTSIRRRRRRMRRQSGRRGRRVAFVVRFKGVTVLVELAASFLMMSK